MKFYHAKDFTLVVTPGAIGSISQTLGQSKLLNAISLPQRFGSFLSLNIDD